MSDPQPTRIEARDSSGNAIPAEVLRDYDELQEFDELATETQDGEADTGPLSSGDRLTDRQRLFVAFLGQCNWNRGEAARLAGYRADNRTALQKKVHLLCKRPTVQRAIRHAYMRYANKRGFIYREVAAMAGADMSFFLNDNNDLDLEKAAAFGALGMIKKYKIKYDGNNNIIGREIELVDKLRALEMQARMAGLLRENTREGDREGDIREQVTLSLRKAMDDPAYRRKLVAAANILRGGVEASRPTPRSALPAPMEDPAQEAAEAAIRQSVEKGRAAAKVKKEQRKAADKKLWAQRRHTVVPPKPGAEPPVDPTPPPQA